MRDEGGIPVLSQIPLQFTVILLHQNVHNQLTTLFVSLLDITMTISNTNACMFVDLTEDVFVIAVQHIIFIHNVITSPVLRFS